MKIIKTGSDFSGVGAFDQALERLNINQDKKFACDMDKYARETYILNFGEPKYYPKNVYNRKIPKDSLDIYMTSPPCQSFSNAGKRLGENDERGILFYNSHEFIKVNKPRFFIFENVKGLLSDDKDKNKKQQYGKTFTTWLQYLGGKSINGVPTLFPHEQAVPYHIYHKVLNAKDYGIPQNRERVFIIGIRDDKDNVFSWPKKQPLQKRLIDVLETNVDTKYFLSDKMLAGFIKHKERHDEKGNGFGFSPTYGNKIASAITTRVGSRPSDDYIKIGAIRGRNPENTTSRKSGLPTEQMLEINENGTSNALTTVQKDNVVVQLNISIEDEKRNTSQILQLLSKEIGSETIKTWGLRILEIIRQEEILQQRLYEESIQGKTKKTTITNNNKVQSSQSTRFNAEINMQNRELQCEYERFRLLREALSKIQKIWKPVTHEIPKSYKIRRLTPMEAFRLMDFNDSFKWNVSDTQAYKQAGNSICVGVLAAIISKLKL